MKRVRLLAQVVVVVAACFVKIFPLSGILFGVSAVILLSRYAGPNRFGDWFGRPKSWPRTLTVCIVAAILSMTLSYSLIELFRASSIGGPDFSRFLVIRGNGKLLAIWLVAIWSIVAFGEEVIGRGFLIDRLLLGFRGVVGAPLIAVGLSAVAFGTVHFYQGVAGVIDNTVTGLIFGALYLIEGRNLWANVFCHGLIDSVVLIAFYVGAMP